MSAEQKRNFDTIFKIFIAAAVAFFSWLGQRTVNQFDAVQKAVEEIRVSANGMKTDIEWLKSAVNKK